MPLAAAIALATAAAASALFTWAWSRVISKRYQPTGQLVWLGHGKIHYTRRAPEVAALGHVLLIHGASGNEADMMIPLGDRLAAKGFGVVAIDRPGHGCSDRLGADTLKAQAATIALFCRRIGVGSAIVVGHSLGGAVATTFALENAELTAGLVLLSSVTHPWPGGAVGWHSRVAAAPVIGRLFAWTLVAPVGLSTIDRLLTTVFAPQPTPANYAARTGVKRVLRPSNFIANARDLLDLYPTVKSQVARLSTIKSPTALIAGDEDKVVSTRIHSMAAHAAIDGSRLTILRETGHSPHWSQPDLVVDAICAIALRRNDAGKPRDADMSTSGA